MMARLGFLLTLSLQQLKEANLFARSLLFLKLVLSLKIQFARALQQQPRQLVASLNFQRHQLQRSIRCSQQQQV